MNQQVLLETFRKVAADAKDRGVPIVDAIVDYAKTAGLSEAQTVKLAQANNMAHTIAHLRTHAGTPVAADSFSLVDPSEVIAKYASSGVELKNHPKLETDTPKHRNSVTIVDDTDDWFSGLNRKAASVNTTMLDATGMDLMGLTDFEPEDFAKLATVEVTPVMEPQIEDTRPLEVKVAEALKATKAAITFLNYREIEYDKCAGEQELDAEAIIGRIRNVAGQTPDYKFASLQYDVATSTEEQPPCMDDALSAIKLASDVCFDLAKDRIGYVAYDRYGLIPDLTKLAKAIELKSIFNEATKRAHESRLFLIEKVASLADGDDRFCKEWHDWCTAVIKTAASLADLPILPDEETATNTQQATVDASDVVRQAGLPPSSRVSPTSAPAPPPIDPPRAEVAVTTQTNGQQQAVAARRLLGLLLEPTIPDAPKSEARQQTISPKSDSIRTVLRNALIEMREATGNGADVRVSEYARRQSDMRSSVRDAQLAATLMKLQITDPILNKADPNRVMELANDIVYSAPDIATQPERLRAALREAVNYDMTPSSSLVQQSEITRGNPTAHAAFSADPKPVGDKPKSTQAKAD